MDLTFPSFQLIQYYTKLIVEVMTPIGSNSVRVLRILITFWTFGYSSPRHFVTWIIHQTENCLLQFPIPLGDKEAHPPSGVTGCLVPYRPTSTATAVTSYTTRPPDYRTGPIVRHYELTTADTGRTPPTPHHHYALLVTTYRRTVQVSVEPWLTQTVTSQPCLALTGQHATTCMRRANYHSQA